MEQSNRELKNMDTGEIFSLFTRQDKSYILVNLETREVLECFLACFLDDGMEYKFEDKSIVKIGFMEFKPLPKGVRPTHEKIVGYNQRFVKY